MATRTPPRPDRGVDSSPSIPRWTQGDRLRKAREVAGLSQQELAEELGVARRTVSAYEVGERHPRAALVQAWAARCDIAPAWLMERTETPG